MVLPTVELGGKEDDQDTKIVFPTMSTVEQPQKTTNNKKYKYFAGVVLISVVIIAAVVLGSIALHHHLNFKQKEFDIEPRYDELKVPEHVQVDYERKLIIINNTQHGDIVASSILHDYQKKILAYKDETNKNCYLDTTSDKFDDYISQLAEIDSRTETSVVHRKQSNFSVEPDVLRKFIGDVIADHCESYPTYWLLEDNTVCESGELCRIKRQLSFSGSLSFGNGGVRAHVGLHFHFKKR